MIDDNNNEDIGTLDQANNVLSGLTSRAPKNQLTVDDVYAGTGNYRMSPQEMDAYDQYRHMRSAAPTGALHPYDYYPDYNNNVAAGNFSISGEGSSLSGSTYAPGGGLIPLAMLDARDLAIKQAGLQKQKELDDFHKQFKAPTSKLVGINENLTDAYFSHQQEAWQKALRQSNGDPNKASKLLKSDPMFWAKEKSFHDIAKNGNAVYDQMAKIQMRIDKGDVVSPFEKEAMRRVQESLNPESDEFKNLSQNIRQMQAESELSSQASEMIKKLVTSKFGDFSDRSTDEQNRIIHTEIENFTPEQIKELKDDAKYIYRGSKNYSPEKIDKTFDALMNVERSNRTLSVSNKPKEDTDNDYSNAVETTARLNVDTGNDVKEAHLKSFIPLTAKDEKLEISFPINKGTKDLGDKDLQGQTGSFKGTVSGFGIAYRDRTTGKISTLTPEEVAVQKENKTFNHNLEAIPVALVNKKSAASPLPAHQLKQLQTPLQVDDGEGGTREETEQETQTRVNAAITQHNADQESKLNKLVPVPIEQVEGKYPKNGGQKVSVDDKIKEVRAKATFENDSEAEAARNYRNELKSNPEKLREYKERLFDYRKEDAAKSEPVKKSINKSDIPAKAKAAGYTEKEYEKLLKDKGIEIK